MLSSYSMVAQNSEAESFWGPLTTLLSGPRCHCLARKINLHIIQLACTKYFQGMMGSPLASFKIASICNTTKYNDKNTTNL